MTFSVLPVTFGARVGGRVVGQKQQLSSVQSEILARAFFGSIVPSKGEVSSLYDPTPVMANIDKDDLRSSIEQMSSSIFFLRSGTKLRVGVEMDAFVIPNGDYVKFDVEWTDLFDASGKSIFRQATAEEKEDDKKFRRDAWSRIYLNGPNKPVVAVGQMQVEVPFRFASLTFGSDEVGEQRKVEGLTATVDRCENDVASVTVLGDFRTKKPIVVFYDKTGGRLRTSENSTMTSATNYRLTCRGSGRIAQIGIFLPSEYLTETFEVKATSKPEVFGEDAWKIRSPRYVPDYGALRFVKMDIEMLRAETRVLGRRGYAWYGFNDPRIVAYLPKCDNSCFVQAEMTELELFDSKGGKVEHGVKGGRFNHEEIFQRFDIASSDANDKELLEYVRSVGKLKIHYPASVGIETLTVDSPNASGLEAEFEDSKVTISGMGELKSKSFSAERLSVVRAYDLRGRRLKKLDFSRYRKDKDGTRRVQMGFWGKPVKLEIIVVDKWIDLEFPFDIAAADKLPESQRGHKPSDY